MTWRLYPLLAPLFEALGIAHLVRPSNSRPHADMTTQYPLPYDKIYLWNIPQANTYNKDMRIIIPMSIHPLQSFLTVIHVKVSYAFQLVREQSA